MHVFRPVPYHCQWADRDLVDGIVSGRVDARADAKQGTFCFGGPDEYEFWARRTCGLACLESVLDALGIARPSRAELLKQSMAHGAYRLDPGGAVQGLIYRPFLTWVKSAFGLSGRVLEHCTLDAVAQELDGGSLVMCSVSPEIRRPDEPNVRRGGHLVLVHGCGADTIRFHNPSGFRHNQENVVLPRTTFERFFAGRALSLPILENLR